MIFNKVNRHKLSVCLHLCSKQQLTLLVSQSQRVWCLLKQSVANQETEWFIWPPCSSFFTEQNSTNHQKLQMCVTKLQELLQEEINCIVLYCIVFEAGDFNGFLARAVHITPLHPPSFLSLIHSVLTGAWNGASWLGLWGFASHGSGILSRGWPQWKPLDIPGTHLPLKAAG